MDRVPLYLTARASSPEDPSGIVLHYDDPVCPVTLPAGRQFRLDHTAGVSHLIEAIFPLEPLLWDEMQAELARLIAMLDGQGWTRGRGYHSPNRPVRETITFEDFAKVYGSKWVEIGYWDHCENPQIQVYLQVRHFNSLSPGSFMPPVALTTPIDPSAEDSFIFLMRFALRTDSPIRKELERLETARRLAVSGREEGSVPLSLWLDTPDWRPDGWDGTYVE